MGWLWSSSSSREGDTHSAGANADSSKKPDWALSDERRQRIFGRPSSLQDADKFRDAQAEKELETFLHSLSTSESKSTETTLKQAPKASSKVQQEEQTDHDRILLDGSVNISPGALYPRTMVCRQAFDQAFYCQSLGGKFNDIYRFGHLQSCSEQWGAFWFCMRTKSLPQKDKEAQIRDYYAAREERKRKEFGNSESVWEIREKPVQKAFWKDPDADEDGADLQLKE